MSAQIKRRGLMLVLSSPSGAGKTTLSRLLLESDPNVAMSVSATTRPKRPGEVDGRDYFFIADEKFQRMVEAGEFLEHALVFGHRYGTPREPVLEALTAGRDVLFDIDWQGTQQLRQQVREDVVTIFVLPPSRAELERRLHTRAQIWPRSWQSAWPRPMTSSAIGPNTTTSLSTRMSPAPRPRSQPSCKPSG